MDSDPYTTPEAKVTATAAVEGPPRPIRGILLALVFDFVGTTIAAAILTIIFGAFLAARGMDMVEINSILLSENLFSKWNLFLICIGLGFSYYSGKICVQVSRANNFLYPGILVGIGTLLSLILFPSTYGVGTEIALFTLGAGFVLLGAGNELQNRRGADLPA